MRMASTYYHGIFQREDTELPVKLREKNDLGTEGLDKLLKEIMLGEDLVATQVKWRDRNFKINYVVVISRKDALEMEVGIIKSILIRRKEVFLVVQRCRLEENYLKYSQMEISFS